MQQVKIIPNWSSVAVQASCVYKYTLVSSAEEAGGCGPHHMLSFVC